MFDRNAVTTPSQVIYSATHWLRTWIVLLKPGARDTILTT
jgi:hypothetical protein